MQRTISVWLLSWLCLLSWSSGETLTGKLIWRNGDSLPGRLAGAVQNVVEWDSRYFEHPLAVQTPFLESVVFDRPANSQHAQGPFRVGMTSGDVIHGAIPRMDEAYLVLNHPRHGTTRLHRSEVAQIRRLDASAQALYLGPNGRNGWRTLRSMAKMDQWAMRPGGGLQTQHWRAELYRPVSLPARCEVELILSSSQRPEFTLAFNQSLVHALRLETWNDELVLTQGQRFEPVLRLLPEDRQVHLRLFWDAPTGVASVFSGGGDFLARMPFDVAPERTGAYLRNKGADLEFEKLRVSSWNGQTPVPLDSNAKNRVHLLDGSVLYGRVLEIAEGTLTLEDGRSISLESIDTIHFEWNEALTSVEKGTEVTYPDGTLVSGQLEAVESGNAKLRTTYSPDPFSTQLEGAKGIRFYVQNTLPGEGQVLDELHMDGKTWKGEIEGSSNPESPIRWRNQGSTRSQSLKGDQTARIVRYNAPAPANLQGDRLFLTSGEIVSCKIERVDDSFVDFTTKLGTLNQLPVGKIRAMEFSQAGLQLTGFGDGAWVEIETAKDRVSASTKTLELDGGSFFHPSILRGDEIRFDLRWRASSHGAISMGMFATESSDI